MVGLSSAPAQAAEGNTSIALSASALTSSVAVSRPTTSTLSLTSLEAATAKAVAKPKTTTATKHKTTKPKTSAKVKAAARKAALHKVAVRKAAQHKVAVRKAAQHKAAVRKAAAQRAAFGSRVIREAALYRGTPYRYGAAGPSRFDCSGFTRFIFAKFGISLPHSSSGQYSVVRHIASSQKRIGDLVFFHSGSGHVYHVGIYAGGDEIWAATHTGDFVRLEGMWNASYYVGRIT
jgi:cell wall-associated NlpC family hydrolase